MDTAHFITQFIDEIWNQQRFDRLPHFLHPDFTDHSLPSHLPPNATGLQAWISAVGQSFQHQTIIEDQVTEGDKSILKVRLALVHSGVWRDIAPTGVNVSAIGYRSFRITEDKIIEHWALIDGNTIENQLKDTVSGCKK
ncbi:Predicted ester cyclase [Chitinophaga sp. CF118]|uniref:ester cyclase n=1 Tax=Chitinophaga sp. CF118 TaxID=1884367 RepID=UPI0008E4613D|nr:ester cyclase [Chitinophaga sp. CF118]SFE44052.1 Predicted ester cyclase [Chitinophaga sp. CF118]